MKTYPLPSISIAEAMQMQFRLVDIITRHFDGEEVLTLGDLGVVPGLNRPKTAMKVEKVLAEFFGVPACTLTRGAGTGALRAAFFSMFKHGEKILIHDAPIYPTTKVTVQAMGLECIRADYNNIEEIRKIISENPDIKGALVQFTRQKPDDSYDMGEVIRAIKAAADIPVITDDNYAVMKVPKIGVELGADLSAFSAFKLLGPEGVGVLVGTAELVNAAGEMNYSGGGKVQGFEAMEVLRGLVYAPVALAIQAEQNEMLVKKLNNNAIRGVKNAFLANAQSKVLLVEFGEPIAQKVLEHACKLGAAQNPVGAESKYEIAPMFYRVSGTFIASDPTLVKRMIRINPMRAGADTVLRILEESINRATKES